MSRYLLLFLCSLVTYNPIIVVRAHYYGMCIGTDDPTQAMGSFCSDDNLYVYVCTNHGALHYGCFYGRDNQARVDVTSSALTPAYSRRPTKDNTMAGTSYSNAQPAPDCVGSTATTTNTICRANNIKPNHCSCRANNWFRYGPLNQANTPASFTASVYGYGCQSAGVVSGATKTFSTIACTNTYPAFTVTTPCSGSFPCTRGTAGAPSVFENTPGGAVVAHLDYADCDTCTSTHVNRPACTLAGAVTTLGDLNTFPTVDWATGVTEPDPVFELADDAGGRFVIEAGTNKLKTAGTALNYEEPSSLTGVGSWSCGDLPLVDLGSSGCTSTNKCAMCRGDCDNDNECAAGLVCFQRDTRVKIPGCAAGGAADVLDHDYCYSPKIPAGGLKCFSGAGITNQVTSLSSGANRGSLWNGATKTWTLYVYVTDVAGCKATGGASFKSGPFPIHIQVENVNEAPDTVILTAASVLPMTSAGKLLELEASAGSNPTPWSLSTNRKIGTFTYSPVADCGSAGVTCFFECKNAAGGWFNGLSNKCGGPSKNTFQIGGSNLDQLYLATAAPSAVNFEATAQSLDVTVRVVVQDSAGNQMASVGTDVSVAMANVNEIPSDVSFTPVSIQEAVGADVVVGTLAATDPDCGTPCLTSQTYVYAYTGPPEFKVVGNQVKTTTYATNFEPPGPAYTFSIRVTDQGGLPTAGQVVQQDFTVVVTDLIEAPSASDTSFTVDENVATGTFVGNYGDQVTLGDAELTFDIVGWRSNSARNSYCYSALSVNAGTGKATMTLCTSYTQVIKIGDKLSVWDDSTKKSLKVQSESGKILFVDAGLIQFEFPSAVNWQEEDVVFFDVTCSDENTRTKMNGPKPIVASESSTVFKVKAYGFTQSEVDTCSVGTVWITRPILGAPNPNGVFTVTSVIGTTVEFSTGIEGAHVGTWSAGGFAHVMGFDMEACSGILTVASNALDYEYNKPQSFRLKIQVRTEATINTATVTVNIQDIDEAPFFVSMPTDLTVDECGGTTTAGCTNTYEVALDGNGNTFMIDDPEGQSDFNLQVLVDAGNRNGDSVLTWEVINTAPRKLRRISSAVLDFETKATYNLKIKATDVTPPYLSIQVDVTVTVKDVNEPPQFFGGVSFDVLESAGVNDEINPTALTVLDPEGAATTLKIDWSATVSLTNLQSENSGSVLNTDRPFSWRDGDANAASSAKILKLNNGPLNYENIAVYKVSMKACDAGNLCSSGGVVTIEVQDVNEKPSWDASSTYIFYVSEDDTEGKVMTAATGLTEVGSLAQFITDPDSGGSHEFSVTMGPSGAVVGWLTTAVSLNSELGKPLKINVAAATPSNTQPDFENVPLLVSGSATSPPAYQFNVYVKDNEGLFADTAQKIEIRIIDMNE